MVCRKRRVAYGSGDTRYADKARGIVGLTAQMRCVAERGDRCVARLMRLALKSVREI